MVKCYYGYFLYPSYKEGIATFLKRVKIWHDSRGPVWTADTVKLHRLALTRYLTGHPLPRPAGISLTRDGLPKLIPHHLRELVRAGNPRGISLSLTLLSVTRIIQGGKPVDLTAIEQGSDFDLTKVRPFIKPFLDHYQIEKINTDWKAYHWSTKAGPSGPSLVSSLGSWRFLPNDLKDDILTIGGPYLRGVFESYSKWPTDLWDALIGLFPCKSPDLFRKLAVKADREAKSRVFAMCDYYSQTVLRPIHLGLFQGLKKIPSDRTFVQAEGLTFDPLSDSYHSLDLSNATDRFPMQLQKELLSHLIGQEKAEAWARILTGNPFAFQGRMIAYAVGQPMGAYSSWSAFTMAHHLVVFAAAQLAGKPAGWSNYAILGDDIVIADDSVASQYRLILSDLKVPISEQKTHVSKDTYEFAKRWFYKGEEVTPFPIHGLMEVVKKYHLLLEFLRQVEKKGFSETKFTFRKPGHLPSLLRIHGFRGRLLASYIRKFSITASIPLAGATPQEVYESCIRFVTLAGISLSCNLRFASVVRIFERFAAQAATWTLARESERILMTITTWHKAMGEALGTLPEESVDQTELLDEQAEVLPVLGALSARAEESLDKIGPDELTGVVGSTIWDKMSRLQLTNIPDVKGINPTRSSYQVAGARATWALNLARVWKRHEKGLRP